MESITIFFTFKAGRYVVLILLINRVITNLIKQMELYP